MRTIQISSSKTQYPVYIGDGAVARLTPLLRARGKTRVFIITSPKIWAPWQRQLRHAIQSQAHVFMVQPGEKHKNLNTIQTLAEQLARGGAARDALLIAFGGGVIGDITGFLAATYMRGIDYLQIPTTLLAQVDSSVGGKTGVNLKAGKNLVGSFNPPRAVFADTQFLQTLPVRELRAGLYESIKAGILGDKKLFATLERFRPEILARDAHALSEITTASVRVKAKIVMQDEHERGVRMTLNLGHTLGHAIEAATRYRQLLHGEAVAWGLRLAAGIAQARGVLSQENATRIDNLILAYGPPPDFSASDSRIVRLTYGDKKNDTRGRRFILPTAIGKTIVATDVTDEEMLTAMKQLRTR
ncbi:MAG TPA: 3-dehydroquinate synthase [Acidobacteriaceae bacterium]|nr:3-dehydroquinate synthase [Acidobacteriaceae bacterium]